MVSLTSAQVLSMPEGLGTVVPNQPFRPLLFLPTLPRPTLLTWASQLFTLHTCLNPCTLFLLSGLPFLKIQLCLQLPHCLCLNGHLLNEVYLAYATENCNPTFLPSAIPYPLNTFSLQTYNRILCLQVHSLS